MAIRKIFSLEFVILLSVFLCLGCEKMEESSSKEWGPQALKAEFEDRQVVLSWDIPSENKDGRIIIKYQYRIKKGEEAYENWVDISNDRSSGSYKISYKVTPFTDDTSYTFQVRVVSDVGNSPPATAVAEILEESQPSAPVSSNTPSPPPPTPVSSNTPSPPPAPVSSNTPSPPPPTPVSSNTPSPPPPAPGSNPPPNSEVATASAPTNPQNLKIIRRSQGVKLSWTASSDSGRAIIKHQYRKKQGRQYFRRWVDIPNSASGEANQVSYTISPLAYYEAYSIEVRAINDFGESTPSNAVDFYLTPIPKALSVTLSSPIDHTVKLTWSYNKPDFIIKFQYRKKRIDAINYDPWVDITNSRLISDSHETAVYTSTVTSPSLIVGESYTFDVRAVNNIGPGPLPSARTGDPVKVKELLPKRVTELIVMPRDRGAYLIWNFLYGVPHAIRHEYRQKAGSGEYGSWIHIPDSAVERPRQRRHWVYDLTNGTTYTFQVRAVNKLGNGPPSTAAVTVTNERLLPLAPRKAHPYESRHPPPTVILPYWRTPNDRGSNILHYELRKKIQGGSFGEWIKLFNTERLGQGNKLSSKDSHAWRSSALVSNNYVFQLSAMSDVGRGEIVEFTHHVDEFSTRRTFFLTSSSNQKLHSQASSSRHFATAKSRHLAASATTASDLEIDAVQNLSTQSQDGEIILSWEPPPSWITGISEYKYREKFKNKGGEFTSGSWISIPLRDLGEDSKTSYTVASTNGILKTFELRAMDGSTVALEYNEVSGMALPAPSNLTGTIDETDSNVGIGTNLKTGKEASRRIMLSWDPFHHSYQPFVSFYILEVSTDGGNAWSTLEVSPPVRGSSASYPYAATKLRDEEVWKFRVSAKTFEGHLSPTSLSFEITEK